MTNISRRFAERGDGGLGGSTGSGSPLIDLVNNRLTFKFMLPIGWIDILANSLPARGYICIMVTAGPGQGSGLALLPYCGMDPRTQLRC